jgi:hypothetical protein
VPTKPLVPLRFGGHGANAPLPTLRLLEFWGVLVHNRTMKLSTKIALWVYLTGVVLADIVCLRSGYVFGGYRNMHSLGDLVLYLAVNAVVALTWPVWAIMIALQLLGFVEPT